jgi:hypothetical protein
MGRALVSTQVHRAVGVDLGELSRSRRGRLWLEHVLVEVQALDIIRLAKKLAHRGCLARTLIKS